MIPLALELASAGHEVTVAAGSDLAERAATLGLPTLQAGLSQTEAGAEMRRRLPGGLDRGAEQWKGATPFFTEVVAPPMVAELMAALCDRQPDLIVHDPAAYAGPLVARLLGIPSVCHHYSVPAAAEVAEYRGEAVAPLWDHWGVPARPLGGIYDYLVLCPCPPGLWESDATAFPTVRRVRPTWVESGGRPGWIDALGDVPTVYVSFGTAFGTVDLFRTILEGLRHESLNVVVTVGTRVDPEHLGPQSPNVHVDRYIPQSVLLPLCDLVVCHAGAGTMLGALAHGLPLVCIPMGADHFINAELCQSAQVGRVLRADALTPDAIRSELRVLLDDPAYRRRATALQTEIDQMPAPAEWVHPLERLADEHRHPAS